MSGGCLSVAGDVLLQNSHFRKCHFDRRRKQKVDAALTVIPSEEDEALTHVVIGDSREVVNFASGVPVAYDGFTLLSCESRGVAAVGGSDRLSKGLVGRHAQVFPHAVAGRAFGAAVPESDKVLLRFARISINSHSFLLLVRLGLATRDAKQTALFILQGGTQAFRGWALAYLIVCVRIMNTNAGELMSSCLIPG